MNENQKKNTKSHYIHKVTLVGLRRSEVHAVKLSELTKISRSEREREREFAKKAGYWLKTLKSIV